MIGETLWTPMYVLTAIVGSICILVTLFGYWSERQGQSRRAETAYRLVRYGCLLLMLAQFSVFLFVGGRVLDFGLAVYWGFFAHVAKNEAERVSAP